MSLWSRECPVCADIGWCNDHPIKDHDDMTTKPNEPEGLQERVARELCRQAGYDPDGAARNGWGWRNYMDAAAQIVAIFPAQPVADAGGVTDADREAAAKCVEHGLSRPNPLNVRQGVVDSWHLVQAFAAHRLQSVAAATAAKDAEIARIMRVIDVFRRHYELNDCDGRTGNIEIPVSALRAAASLSSALSEAREAGAKD
jgi:hypothetical protein